MLRGNAASIEPKGILVVHSDDDGFRPLLERARERGFLVVSIMAATDDDDIAAAPTTTAAGLLRSSDVVLGPLLFGRRWRKKKDNDDPAAADRGAAAGKNDVDGAAREDGEREGRAAKEVSLDAPSSRSSSASSRSPSLTAIVLKAFDSPRLRPTSPLLALHPFLETTLAFAFVDQSPLRRIRAKQ